MQFFPSYGSLLRGWASSIISSVSIEDEDAENIDMIIAPMLNDGDAAVTLATFADNGTVVNVPFVDAYPVDPATHNPGLVQIASAAYFHSAV